MELLDKKENNTNIRKSNAEKLNFLPLFYCKICDKEFHYKKAIEHLEQDINNHVSDCMISEEIIIQQEYDIAKNILNLLEKRKKEMTSEKIKTDKILQKIKEFTIYFIHCLYEIEKENIRLLKLIKEDLKKNEKNRAKVIELMNKKVHTLKDKYIKLQNFKVINNQLNNTYLAKNSFKEIKEKIEMKKQEFNQYFLSFFVFDTNNNTFNIEETLNNNNEYINLKNELSKLGVEELKALNEKLKEKEDSDNFNTPETFELNGFFKSNSESINFLNNKRKRIFF